MCIFLYAHATSSVQSRIQELSQALMPTALQTGAALVDPLVNNLFSRLKAELQAYKEKAEEARADYEAKTFTPERYGLVSGLVALFLGQWCRAC